MALGWFPRYAVIDDSSEMDELVNGASKLLFRKWAAAGLNIPRDFSIAKYHELVENWNIHLENVNHTKLVPVNEFPVPLHHVIDRVSKLCSTDLVATNPHDGQSVFHFRVIRPGQHDNNPLHRDAWLDDYDDCINLYIPIAGSNKDSSLVIIPGSHRWPESSLERTVEGAVIGNVKFNVPAVTSIKPAYQAIRPDPAYNEFLLFSPYLVHGGAANLNTDITRISIEMRLWKR